jgi:hypothetical protein
LAGIGLIYYFNKNGKLLSWLPLQKATDTSLANNKATGTQNNNGVKGDTVAAPDKKKFPETIPERIDKPDYTQTIQPVTVPITTPLEPKQSILVRIFNLKRETILPPQALPYVYDEEGILVPNGQYKA